jgi:hypothetical protein
MTRPKLKVQPWISQERRDAATVATPQKVRGLNAVSIIVGAGNANEQEGKGSKMNDSEQQKSLVPSLVIKICFAS